MPPPPNNKSNGSVSTPHNGDKLVANATCTCAHAHLSPLTANEHKFQLITSISPLAIDEFNGSVSTPHNRDKFNNDNNDMTTATTWPQWCVEDERTTMRHIQATMQLHMMNGWQWWHTKERNAAMSTLRCIKETPTMEICTVRDDDEDVHSDTTMTRGPWQWWCSKEGDTITSTIRTHQR